MITPLVNGSLPSSGGVWSTTTTDVGAGVTVAGGAAVAPDAGGRVAGGMGVTVASRTGAVIVPEVSGGADGWTLRLAGWRPIV